MPNEALGQQPHGLGPVRADEGRWQADRALDRRGFATFRPAQLVEDGGLASERVGFALAVPDVGAAGDDRKGPPFAAAADEEWQASLQWRRLVACAAGHEPCPLEVRRLAVEHAATDRRGFLEAVEPLSQRREVVPEGRVLGRVPSGAETEDRAAAARVIEGRRHADEQRWVAIGDPGDEASEPDVGGPLGPAGERHPAVPHRPALDLERDRAAARDREQVVVAPEAVEPELVDPAAHRHELVPADVLAPDLEADPDAHDDRSRIRRSASSRKRTHGSSAVVSRRGAMCSSHARVPSTSARGTARSGRRPWRPGPDR